MRKFKNSVGLGLLLVSATVLSGCGKNKPIKFWSCFGNEYSGVIKSLVATVNSDLGFNVDVEEQKSYPNIFKNIQSNIGSGEYPNLCIGYPDHFITYEASGILVDLTDYISDYDKKHHSNIMHEGEGAGKDGGYIEKYMEENKQIVYDSNGNGVVTALPFNKSTEVMAYNSVFVDFCDWWCQQNPTATIVEGGAQASTWNIGQNGIPNSWEDWAEKGPYYRHIMDQLIGTKTEAGKNVFGTMSSTGKASNFEVKDAGVTSVSGKKLLLSFEAFDPLKTRVLGYDDGTNMLITILRQWGSGYTEIKGDDIHEDSSTRKGYMKFLSPANINKTLDCLKFFEELAKQRIVGVSHDILDENYCTKAFEGNHVMFTICSSGGIHRNVEHAESSTRRVKVRPIPYHHDASGDHKVVISQGANIAMLDQGNKKQKENVFEFMVKITSGKYQAKWCLDTGYFPASTSALQDPTYQAFLNNPSDLSDMKTTSHKEAADVNTNEYVNSGNWDKFVDPAFNGSATIRDKISDFMHGMFGAGMVAYDSGMTQFENYCKKTLDLIADDLVKNCATNTIKKDWTESYKNLTY